MFAIEAILLDRGKTAEESEMRSRYKGICRNFNLDVPGSSSAHKFRRTLTALFDANNFNTLDISFYQ
jgi:hypothetical protein